MSDFFLFKYVDVIFFQVLSLLMKIFVAMLEMRKKWLNFLAF